MNDGRFQFRLSPEHRRELSELASEAGLSSSDLVRLSVRWLLENPGVLLRQSPRLDDHTQGEN